MSWHWTAGPEPNSFTLLSLLLRAAHNITNRTATVRFTLSHLNGKFISDFGASVVCIIIIIIIIVILFFRGVEHEPTVRIVRIRECERQRKRPSCQLATYDESTDSTG